jgi:nucleotide-binding universal stress UspA family protein
VRFRTILCAVDFSVHSRRALQYAAAIAAQFAGRITVISVNDPLLAAAARAESTRESLAGQTRAELADFVERSLRGPLSNLKQVEVVTAEGEAAVEILRAAKRRRADLIVIGTEGLSGVRRLFFGSTAARVLEHATIPVLTVPRRRIRATSVRLLVSRIVAPVDFNKGWQTDAFRAAAIARAFDAELLVASVVPRFHTPGWLRIRGATDRERLAAARATLARATHRLGSVAATRRLRTVVVLGDPATEIARLTRHQASLVVMSVRGRPQRWGGRGSTAYHIVTQSSAPVLVFTN